jgi:peptide/nickel transport system permease protein
VRFLLVRAVAALALVFAVTSGAVLLAQLAPGDYAGQFGRSPAEIAADRHRLGLDRPMWDQYTAWLTRTLTLDLGESLTYQRPVISLIRERAANTAQLAIAALAVATLLGIPWGVITGTRDGIAARMLRALSLLLISVPPLIGAILLLTIAAATGWFPISGMDGPRHFVVPTLALALPIAAMLERLQSQSIGEALKRPSSAAALARGMSRRRVIWRHAWRQSLAPILGIYGVVVGSLFSGSFAVEYVTSWPGLGELMRMALMARDTNLVAGCAAAGAAFLALGIFGADLAQALTDPRVRAERAR